MRKQRAFTLVELLVVIGIIVILVSILLPVLNSAREQAKEVTCQHNLHTLWQGFMMFASDNDNRMPGGANPADSQQTTYPNRWDWLEGYNATYGGNSSVLNAPQKGTIFKYINNYNVYLCPTIESTAQTTASIGAGSNGRFDYTAFEFFSGCHVSRLPKLARYTDPTTGQYVQIPCPLVVEEQSNTMNGGDKDPNHSSGDLMAHIHRGGCFYLATDGSVQFFIEPTTGIQASSYTGLSVRNKWSSISTSSAYAWGYWETQ